MKLRWGCRFYLVKTERGVSPTLADRLLSISVELTVGMAALMLVTKILGPIQISQMTPFHFISAIVLGELLGNAVYEPEVGILNVLYALALWTALMASLEWLTRKYPGSRSFLQGKPAILIRRGKIDRHLLRANRMNINELQALLRKKGVFTVREVEYAILESDGSLSVFKKPVHDTPKKQELNIQPGEGNLPFTLISDGKVLTENLGSCGFTAERLRGELAAHGVLDPKDVFYAEWQEGQGLLVQQFNA